MFNRHVTQKLCWIDGSPTHASSARQRQCSLCRRKWSYDGLSKRWLLAQEYCAGRSRRVAARAAGVDVHTAGRHYAAFERALTGHLRRNLELGHAWKFAAIRSPRRIGAENPPSPAQIRRVAAQHCLEGLSVYRRMQLIYDVAFAAGVERLLRQKAARSQ